MAVRAAMVEMEAADSRAVGVGVASAPALLGREEAVDPEALRAGVVRLAV